MKNSQRVATSHTDARFRILVHRMIEARNPLCSWVWVCILCAPCVIIVALSQLWCFQGSNVDHGRSHRVVDALTPVSDALGMLKRFARRRRRDTLKKLVTCSVFVSAVRDLMQDPSGRVIVFEFLSGFDVLGRFPRISGRTSYSPIFILQYAFV